MTQRDAVEFICDTTCGRDAVHALLVIGTIPDPVKRERYLKDVLRHTYMSGMLAGLEASDRARRGLAPTKERTEDWLQLVRT